MISEQFARSSLNALIVVGVVWGRFQNKVNAKIRNLSRISIHSHIMPFLFNASKYNFTHKKFGSEARLHPPFEFSKILVTFLF